MSLTKAPPTPKTKVKAKAAAPARRSTAKEREAQRVEAARDTAFTGYFQLLILVAVLCAFGLMMVLSSSSVEALRNYKNSWFFFQRQAMWLVLGVGVLFVAMRIDYNLWRKWTLPMLAGSAASSAPASRR